MAETYGSPFRVLISCILSLRTQDSTTAQASHRLFALADTPQKMVKLRAASLPADLAVVQPMPGRKILRKGRCDTTPLAAHDRSPNYHLFMGFDFLLPNVRCPLNKISCGLSFCLSSRCSRQFLA